MRYINWSLVDLSHANLMGADLSKAQLRTPTIVDTNMHGVNLSDADIQDVVCEGDKDKHGYEFLLAHLRNK